MCLSCLVNATLASPPQDVSWFSRTKRTTVITRGASRATCSCCSPLPSSTIYAMSYHVSEGKRIWLEKRCCDWAQMLRLSQHANILIRPIRAVVFIVEHSAETMQQAVQRSTWCMKNPGRCHVTYSLPKSSVTLVLRDNRTMYDFEGPPVRDPLFKNNRHRCV